MTSRNIGDLLNAAGVTWGFFAEGFDTTASNSDGSTGCRRSHTSTITRQTSRDYIPHHEAFQYYVSTANPTHARPTSIEMIGHANDGSTAHQYDIHDFFDAVAAGNFPSVSFLKSAAYRDGHAGYSDPLDEQAFLVHAINTIEQTPQWANTVIIVAYDDSDGWYDHVSNVINGSATKRMLSRLPGSVAMGRPPCRRCSFHFACAGQMRLRTTTAAPGNLPVGQGKLRFPYRDRPDFNFAIYRRQLSVWWKNRSGLL
jgi:phospholipase C